MRSGTFHFGASWGQSNEVNGLQLGSPLISGLDVDAIQEILGQVPLPQALPRTPTETLLPDVGDRGPPKDQNLPLTVGQKAPSI